MTVYIFCGLALLFSAIYHYAQTIRLWKKITLSEKIVFLSGSTAVFCSAIAVLLLV